VQKINCVKSRTDAVNNMANCNAIAANHLTVQFSLI